MSEDQIDIYVHDCIKRIKARQLPPHHTACLHVISYLKESNQYDAAIEFWNWVVNQDDKYVDLKTYGAAIELLAACGRGLAACEEVYAHGLKRFSAAFNEYHMSHGALLRNRDEITVLPKTSMTLQQGIIAARLTYGDWKNAYLGLDTALRLHPTQIPPYTLQAFVRERPVQEAYQVFCLLCQGGSPVRPETLTTLLADLVCGQGQSTGENFDLDIATAVLNAIRLYAGSGQTVTPIHLNILLQSSLYLPPTNHAISSGSNAPGDDSATHLTNQILSLFASLGVDPKPSTSNIIMAAAIRFQDKALQSSASATLLASASAPGRGHHNRGALSLLLKVAGRLGDAARVEETWNSRDQSVALTLDNWVALVQATIFTDNSPFLEKQLEVYGLSNDLSMMEKLKQVAYMFQNVKEHGTEAVADDETREKCIAVVARYLAALDEFRTLIEKSDYQNLEKHPPKSLSIWPAAESVNEEWHKKLYDELTLDSTATSWEQTQVQQRSQPNLETQSTVGMGPVGISTGIPLGELRYRNWKGINDLLQHAELFEARIERSVAKAISEGEPARLVRSSNGIDLKRLRQHVVRGHLIDHFLDLQQMNSGSVTEQVWKEKILRLRQRNES